MKGRTSSSKERTSGQKERASEQKERTSEQKELGLYVVVVVVVVSRIGTPKKLECKQIT